MNMNLNMNHESESEYEIYFSLIYNIILMLHVVCDKIFVISIQLYYIYLYFIITIIKYHIFILLHSQSQYIFLLS